MDQVLQALGGILLRALPTFLIVLVLSLYLKRIFFAPLEKVLEERRKVTEGAREAAEECLRKAAEKTAAYEQALRGARAEIYREQEQQRRQWRAEQEEALKSARQSAEELVAQAKAGIEHEAAEAKASLAAEAEMLASRIADRVLRGKAA